MQRVGDDQGWYACPDSIDALDWLAEPLHGVWYHFADGLYALLWDEGSEFAPTPSALIVAVAQALA